MAAAGGPRLRGRGGAPWRYQSSFTVPIYDGHKLLGFIFFDSTQPNVFDLKVQRDLVLYTTVITMMITNEF